MTVYPVLHGRTAVEGIGGAEVQQVQIAQLLRGLGHEVSFVTEDYGQPDGELIEGCRVFKAYRPSAGWPGLRYFHPRWTGISAAIDRAGADIYYTRAAGFVPGLLALKRRCRSFRYIYAGAADLDFMPGAVLVRFARDRWLFRHGLRHADAIVVQSQRQRDLLARHYGLEGIIIPNFMETRPAPAPGARRDTVLWVGRLHAIKRPMMFVELARAMPELRFTMVAPRTADAALADQVENAARSVPNLEYHGFRPFAEVEEIFTRCRVLVSTSTMEGFPNVFLQALRRGVPIVSFVDPDDMIARNGLGAVAQSEAELHRQVQGLMQGPGIDPAPIRAYFESAFSPAAVAARYRDLLAQLTPGAP